MWINTLILLVALCLVCVLCQSTPTCDPPCKAGTETCVMLSRCTGKQCNMCAESSSIQVNKAASVQIPGMGQLQKQQLQMLLQAKMLQQQNQDPTNIATDATLIDPVTPPPNDWSTIFGGNTANTVNTANTGAAAGSNSFSMNDYFLSGYLFDGFGMGLMA
ncbi:uncharacterized protein [Magallana gigas]|nr:uncharacterized protein LOC105332382 [Crassostrea gigas]